MDREEIVRKVLGEKIVAIMRGIAPERCSDAANALSDGGICAVEVTFDQREQPAGFASTAEGIRRIIAGAGTRNIAVGAGTVLTPEQAEIAREAGASFIVTPNTDPEVIKAARSLGMAAFPGAFTPSEVVAAFAAGADMVKIFPASSVGPGYIRALRGPLPHIPLMAVGGVELDNARAFLDAGAAGLGIGGGLVNRKLINEGRYEEITALAAAFRASVRNA